MRTTTDVAEATRVLGSRLPAPSYRATGDTNKLTLAVASMREHTTDEGWQLMLGLREGGYGLAGRGLHVHYDEVDVTRLLNYTGAGTVVVQDKREWTGRTAGPGFDHREQFINVEALRSSGAFVGVVLKDAHSDQVMHRDCAEQVGAHFWVTYYHPNIVCAQAPYVRREHLVRTYHSLDPAMVPAFADRDSIAVLTGAVSKAYPLRTRLASDCVAGRTKHLKYFPHPGYGRKGCATSRYMELLSKFRVAVCTSSRFGYAVRKIVEATACGCRVVTDLPIDEVLPFIDANLVRVEPGCSTAYIEELCVDLADTWNAEWQRHNADMAKMVYDYRTLGRKLSDDIEKLRRSYGT